jgi:hypothetical protein
MVERKIEIAFKRRGGRRDHVRNTQIACHVYDQVAAGSNVAAGINSAVEKFGVSEELVKKIWGRYRRQLEQTDGRLPVRSFGSTDFRRELRAGGSSIAVLTLKPGSTRAASTTRLKRPIACRAVIGEMLRR